MKIAVVGLGLRLPGGVHDLDDLRRLLRDGADVIRPVPPDRWDPEAWGTPPAGGFLDELATFADADIDDGVTRSQRAGLFQLLDDGLRIRWAPAHVRVGPVGKTLGDGRRHRLIHRHRLRAIRMR